MSNLVLLRHGQSEWNKLGKFTGWIDVDLSPEGCKEARSAGDRLREEGMTFDLVYTSVLKRAIRTTWLTLEGMDLMYLPIHNSWRLNERHYGALQGLSKEEMTKVHGKEAVHAWRRGYDVRPPALELSDPMHPRFDPRYKGVDPAVLPSCESLKDTLGRVLVYWNGEILPKVMDGKDVLVAAHGNSLRALVKHLDGISDDEIAEVNIPTGIPLAYEMKGSKVLGRRYLASEEELGKATAKAAGVR
jgi:2,3-bisphosphoglycerate-dependent phosphoglycerate mutase